VFLFLIDLWQTAVMMTPWLLIGSACVGVLHVVLPPSFFERALSGRGGVVRAVLLGVPLPLCSCAVIPVGMGMHRSGAPRSSTIAFLVSTPQTGVDSIVVTGGFLGWPFAIYRVCVALIMGVVGGLLTTYVEPEKSAPLPLPTQRNEHHSVQEGVEHAWVSILSIWGWVLIGVFVSAAISQMGHVQMISSLALGPVEATTLALVIAIPLYVCATASIPIAASLVAVGLPIEAALVFLIAGPATNAATIGAVYATLGRRVTALYLGLTIIGSVVFAWLFKLCLPGYTIPSLLAQHEHTSQWDILFGLMFVVTSVGWLMPKFRRTRTRTRVSHDPEGQQLINVTGMTCQGCVKKLQRALDESPETKGTEVFLTPGRVVWSGEPISSDVESVIVDCGFFIGEGVAE
jgi:uncharacterized protein